MRTARRKAILLTAVFALSIVAAGCPFGHGAYHDAVVIEHDFKETVKAFQKADTDAFAAGKIPQELHIKIENGIEKVAVAGKTLTDSLLKNAGQATVTGNLLALVGAVDDLNNNGVLEVKNETAFSTLSLGIQTLKSILQNLQTVLVKKGA